MFSEILFGISILFMFIFGCIAYPVVISLLSAWESGRKKEGKPISDQEKQEVVCLCGSTRFRDQFTEANRIETMSGKIVVAPGVFAHSGDPLTDSDKRRLDELHLRKIDMANSILVVNPGGYIGESTRREIEYAEAHGKSVRYTEDHRSTVETGSDMNDPVTIDTVGVEVYLRNRYAYDAVAASMGKDFFIRHLLEVIEELRSELVKCRLYGMPCTVIQKKELKETGSQLIQAEREEE